MANLMSLHPTINNVRAAICRERRKHCGVLPRNVDETIITLKQLSVLTSRREDFLCRCEITDDGGGFVVFTTETNLHTLCNAYVIQWMALFAFVLNSSINCCTLSMDMWMDIISLWFTACCRTKVRLHVHNYVEHVQANCAAMNFYFAPRNVVILKALLSYVR